MKEVSEQLKPCPFCGSEGSVNDDGNNRRVVECAARCFEAVYETDEQAIAAWNRRASGWRPIETMPKDDTIIVPDNSAGMFSAKIEPRYCDQCGRRMSGSYQHWYGVQVSIPAQGSSSTGEMYSYDTKEFFECYPELVNGLTLRLCIICWLRGMGIEVGK